MTAAAAGPTNSCSSERGSTRARHRLPAASAVTTFEVDHPATQARKVAIVAGEGLDTRGVVYVPVDFERDRARHRAPRGGIRPDAPGGLRVGGRHQLPHRRRGRRHPRGRSAQLAAPGSVLVFTYVHAGVIDGTVTFPEAERWVRNVQRAGEPWTFGLGARARCREFLRAPGLRARDRRVDARGRRRALRGARAARRGSELYHVVVAEAA